MVSKENCTKQQNNKNKVIERKYSQPKKSSCVNARDIPTVAYQVLHLLPEVGYPPGSGTPRPRPMGGTQGAA